MWFQGFEFQVLNFEFVLNFGFLEGKGVQGPPPRSLSLISLPFEFEI